MIFVNRAIRQFGEKALIINYKAKVFFDGQKLEKEDFDRLFWVFAEWTFIEIFNSSKK